MRWTFLAGLCAVLLLSGCSGPSAIERNNTSEVEQQVRSAAAAWDGTPHRWGGTSRRGVDCSGLVQAIFAERFDVELPRTTREQARQGQKVRASRRAPGDLVFFKTAPKTRHVGIYLGDGEFVHASSSSGVTVSRLNGAYWQRTYWMSRRILSEVPAAAPSPPAPSPTPESPPSARTGW
ncbi:MAG: hypothetical protein GVY18_10650 [Bacteroidetes bacterium]|jgi:cell wall-associated NlpC family hydrolase|nr:hypothetical protein [Bacteroidota bacterium]